MRILYSLIAVCFCLFLMGASCGAPTDYQKFKSSQKDHCTRECEKAHASSDKDGLRRCLQVCRVKEEMNELEAEEEKEAEEERNSKY